jgi:hypothetical protein
MFLCRRTKGGQRAAGRSRDGPREVVGLEGEFRAQVMMWVKSGRQFMVLQEDESAGTGPKYEAPQPDRGREWPAEQAVTAQEVVGGAADIAVSRRWIMQLLR